MNNNETNKIQYQCHSGGCEGSDMEWEIECRKYGIKTLSYSFYNHVCNGENPVMLSQIEIAEGYNACRKANKSLGRRFDDIMYPYVKNLFARNWFQVKNSDAVYAIGKFQNLKIVDGGTGWAVQMAIDNKKPVYVFEQNENTWYMYNYEREMFQQLNEIPKLTVNFAGVGTRDINKNGKQAIKEILKKNFTDSQ